MTLRALTAGAAMTLLAVPALSLPALADCAQEIQKLDAAVLASETGAATGESAMPSSPHQEQVLSKDGQAAEESGMPATQHQEEVLSDKQERAADTAAGDTTAEATAEGTGTVDSTSPHQRQAVREIDDDSRSQAGELLDEARAKAQAGDEQGCREQLAEAKELLGAE